jgi:hypothetical protein
VTVSPLSSPLLAGSSALGASCHAAGGPIGGGRRDVRDRAYKTRRRKPRACETRLRKPRTYEAVGGGCASARSTPAARVRPALTGSPRPRRPSQPSAHALPWLAAHARAPPLPAAHIALTHQVREIAEQKDWVREKGSDG